MDLFNNQIAGVLRLGVFALLGIGAVFLVIEVIKSIFKSIRNNNKSDKKVMNGARSKKTQKEREMDWKIGKMEAARRNRDYQYSEAERREKRERYETYRMKRDQDRWRR